jgi:hypothetical protein
LLITYQNVVFLAVLPGKCDIGVKYPSQIPTLMRLGEISRLYINKAGIKLLYKIISLTWSSKFSLIAFV